MAAKEQIISDDECADVLLGQARERSLDVLVRFSGEHDQSNAELGRRSLKFIHLRFHAGIARIDERADRSRARYQVAQQGELLAAQRRSEQADAGDVAARPAQARNESCRDGIGRAHEHDRRRLRCRLRRPRRIGAAGGKKDIHFLIKQVGHERRQPLIVAFRPARLDHEIVVFGVTGLLETGEERRAKRLEVTRS
jgi:hypothetical protein